MTKNEEELEQRFQAKFYNDVLEKRYNIAPTQTAAVITGRDPDVIQLFRWGLIPFWAKDPSIGSRMINARSETIGSKPAFKDSFMRKRCLVLSDGFYEWEKRGKTKVPYRVAMPREELFAFAGLWATWKDAEGRKTHSFTIVTTEPSPSIGWLHDRMPVMLRPDQERLWIDDAIPPEELRALLVPFPDDQLINYPVSPLVNSPLNDGPEIIERTEPPPEAAPQGELF